MLSSNIAEIALLSNFIGTNVHGIQLPPHSSLNQRSYSYISQTRKLEARRGNYNNEIRALNRIAALAVYTTTTTTFKTGVLELSHPTELGRAGQAIRTMLELRAGLQSPETRT